MVQVRGDAIEILHGMIGSMQNVERFEEAIIIAEQLAKFSGSESERYKFTLKII